MREGNVVTGVRLSTGGSASWGGSVCIKVDPPSRYSQQADGTHPTGMHACQFYVLVVARVGNKKGSVGGSQGVSYAWSKVPFWDRYIQGGAYSIPWAWYTRGLWVWVATKTRTVGKQAVRILLECFLIVSDFLDDSTCGNQNFSGTSRE